MSGVRAVILAAAVVLGVFGLAQAFPESEGRVITTRPGATPTTNPSATPTTPPKTVPPTTPSPRTNGVKVQILNGSGTAGLAALTSDTVRNANLGYTVLDAGDAAHTSTTTIYYKRGYKVTAEYLQSKLFQDALVQEASTSTFTAHLTVVLGTDYAASVTATATP